MDERLITTSEDAKDQISEITNPAISQALNSVESVTQLQGIFSGFFNNFPEAIIIIDVQGYILQMNVAAKTLLDRPEGNIGLDEWPRHFGLYMLDGLTPYPADGLPLRRALQGETIRDEQVILRKAEEASGSWVSMDCWPLKAEDGSVAGAIAVLLDITAKKRTEQSREKHIQRTETLYKLSRLITESGNDLNQLVKAVAILTSRVIGDLSFVTLWNQDSGRINIAAFYDPDPAARALIRKLVESTPAFDSDQGLSGKVIHSGEPILIPSISSEDLRAVTIPELTEFIDRIGLESVLVVPMVGKMGIIGTVNVARHRGGSPFNHADQAFLTDIADRTALAIENCRLVESLRAEIAGNREVKRALMLSEERFRSIFEASSLGIKLLNLDGNLLHTNPALQAMLGYAESELVGRHLFDFIHPEETLRASKLFHNLKLNDAHFITFEHRALHKNNSVVWVKTTFNTIKRGDGSNQPGFIVGMVENVTEHKRAQMEIAEMAGRLHSGVELERLRLAQELHDNPMQMLYAAIYRIEELRREADPKPRDALEKVNADLMDVLNGLRATAKELRPPTIFSFGLENAIRSYMDDVLGRKPDLTISLSLAHDRQLLPEKVRMALFRVFQQSVMNVLRHAEATRLEVLFSFDAEEARLEIRDDGKGFNVPVGWIEFVRAGHYGLAGASERISALGGTLSVESQPGSTVIRVVVPWKESTESSEYV